MYQVVVEMIYAIKLSIKCIEEYTIV